MSLRTCPLVVWLLVCAAVPAYATDYYVSSQGDDGNTGTSASAPLRTLARVTSLRLADGDRVLLRGGDTFAGPLTIDDADGGTPAAPIVLTSYGFGRPTVTSTSEHAIVVYNRAAVRVTGLTVAGSMTPDVSGIVFYTDAPLGTPHPYVRIDDVEVRGFGQDGIQLGAWFGGAGFSDVRITRASVHDNGRTGILTYADRPQLHRDVYVGYSRAYNTRGIPTSAVNTGSGIVLGSVAGGTIERSVAFNNGAASTAPEGPVGIWTYDSTRVVIQHNESYGNRTGGYADGGGFDLDQNVTDSVVQFNYSHDNDGAGYLIAHRYATDAHRGNVIRFNISQNDGRKNGYGGIQVWGRTIDAAIYHNVVIMSSAATGVPQAFRMDTVSIAGVRSTGVRVLNNIFYTRAWLPLVSVSSDQLAASPALFAGNVYYSTSSFRIAWGATTLTSLDAFRQAGQERVNGMATGLNIDPALQAGDSAPALGDATLLETLDEYRLAAASPAIDRGVALATFGMSAPHDFFGTSLSDVLPDPGVHEAWRNGGVTPPPGDDESGSPSEIILWASHSPQLAGNWSITPDATAAGGARVQNANRGAPKVTSAASAPEDYFELTFTAQAGIPYRLWIRGRAERDSYENDSVYVQFSGSVTASGGSIYRIGTSSATTYVLEDCSGCNVAGWGWQDNGYGLNVLGPVIYFATTGPQTIRIQPREDGLSIDQIVLSPATYLNTSPGATKNDTRIMQTSGTSDLTPPASSDPPPPEPTGDTEIVLWAADAPKLAGDWAVVADTTAAGRARVQNANRNAPKLSTPLATPADYIELTFTALAGVPYRLWIRGRAQNDSYENDSVFVQFSGSVNAAWAPVYRIGSTAAAAVVIEDCSGCGVSGWGWQDNGYGAGVLGAPIYFAASEPQTIRIQTREDGLGIDQIVLSSARYFSNAPGATKGDATILAR